MITVTEHDAFVARFPNYRYHQVTITRADVVTMEGEQVEAYRILFSDSRIHHDQVVNQTMMDFIYRTRRNLHDEAEEAKNKRRVRRGEIVGTEYKRLDDDNDDDDKDDYNPGDQDQNSAESSITMPHD